MSAMYVYLVHTYTRADGSVSTQYIHTVCTHVTLGKLGYITRTHTYTHTYIHEYMHIHIHTYIHTYIHAYMHIHIHTYIHTYIHAYMHIHIHTYIHTYIHTHMPMGVFLQSAYIHPYRCVYWGIQLEYIHKFT